MTKVFGSNDAVTNELTTISQGIGGPLIPVEGASSGGGGSVDSVNGQTGVVVLDADDIDDAATTNKFATAAELTLIASATQPGDNVSTLTNDANYIATDDDAVLNSVTSSLYLTPDATGTVADAITVQPGDALSTDANYLGADITLKGGGGYRTSGGAGSGKGGNIVIQGGDQLSDNGSGGNVSLIGGLSSSVAQARTGGSVIINTQSNDQASGTVSAGSAGQIQILSGNGGTQSAGDTAGGGGSSGIVILQSSAGGDTNNTGSSTAGAGGRVDIIGGPGGDATAGTGNGGGGSTVTIRAGVGGSSAGGTAGANGTIVLSQNGTTAVEVEDDVITLDRVLKLPGISVSLLPSVSDGSIAYCTDGDTGSPCLAVRSGGAWLRVALGAAVST